MFYNLITNNSLLFSLTFLTTFLISFIGIRNLIILLKKHQKFQPIRTDGPEGHLLKAKTPTMGGLPFGLSIIINLLLFCDLNSQFTYIFLFIISGFMLIGLIDDVRKVFYNDTIGFKGCYKLILELLIVGIALLWASNINLTYLTNNIRIPFLNITMNFGILAFPLFALAMVGSANATNITDGLDGLLSVPIIIIATVFSIIIYFLINNTTLNMDNFIIITDKNLLRILLILLFSVLGAFSSFLFFNHHPAKIFMGDVGSLFIGAILFFISFLLKIELFYAIMALLFIVELSSTFLQVFIYKITKKRIFKMAPIHHHFEKCGWPETRVVVIFWLFALLTALLSLALLII